MPITQATAGLIFYDALNSASDIANWTLSSSSDPNSGTGVSYSSKGFQATPNPCFTLSAIISMGSLEGEYGYGEANVARTVNIGSGSGRRAHCWLSAVMGATVDGQATNPGTVDPLDIPSLANCGDTGYLILPRSTDTTGKWTWIGGTIPNSLTGNQVCCLGEVWYDGSDNGNPYGGTCYIYGLVICANDNLTITGLVPGQLVQAYSSYTNSPYSQRVLTPHLVASGTVPAGQTQIVLAIGNEPFPELMYLEIYATDGSTLIETTTPTTICGGDVWAWTPPAPPLSVGTSAFILYVSGSSGTPKTATITATLLQPSGSGYSGQSLGFATTFGTLSAASATTNSSGVATVTLTAPATAGFALVTVTWAGDATVPAETRYVLMHVWLTPEAPNSALPYQFFCEGQPYTFSDGNYSIGTDQIVQTFEVDLPVWNPAITVMGIVSFYRFGVLEFRGVLTRVERILSDTPTVKLVGVDALWLMNTRVVDLAVFSGATPQAMITALLNSYPCGLTIGTLGSASITLAEFFIETQLLSAFQQATKPAAGWQFRVNANLTVDFSNSFGVDSSAVFTEGAGNVIASPSTLTSDLSLVQNSVHVRGGTQTRALGQSPSSLAAYGPLESADLERTTTDQTTLNGIAAGDAMKGGAASPIIQLTVIDGYASGTYHPFDYVTVNSPTLGLSGYYQVKQIIRSTLTNPYATELQLGARMPEAWELDEPVKSNLNQLTGVS